MKVIYFCQYFSTRQGSWYGRPYEFSRRLIERGHEVTMVCGSNTRSATGLEQPFVKGRRDGDCDGIHVVEFDLNYSNYDGVATRTWKFTRNMRFEASSSRFAKTTT